MRLIESGEVDRSGVGGVAERLHVSQRHLTRVLTESVGAGPIALARAQRANLARILIETTDMAITDVAFASGFSSIRQFNDTVREVYDRTPTELRRAGRNSGDTTNTADGVAVTIRLACRPPIDHHWLFGFLAGHRIVGVSTGDSTRHTRTLSLPGGPGHVDVRVEDDELRARFALTAVSDLAPGIALVRRLFDLDVDPLRINEHLAAEPHIRTIRARNPGVRIPGAVDGFEAAVGAVVSQQVSVSAARTFLGRLVEACGAPHQATDLTHLFPTPEAVVDADLDGVGLTSRRITTLRELASAVDQGFVDLTGAQDRDDVRRELLALPGIGPWTADVIAMRALSDPDVLVDGDLVVRRQLDRLGADDTQRMKWSPWRSYVTATLWADSGGTQQ